MSAELLRTGRLVVRRLALADLDAMHAVYGDAAAMRFVGDGEPLGREDCARWIEITHRNYAERGYGMFAIEEQATGAVVGFCGLVHPGGQPEAELKYALLRGCWGRGYATEVARALLAYAAARPGMPPVIATIDPEHAVSQRVLHKAGMRLDHVRAEPDGSKTLVFAPAADGPPR